jgi:hypothetical protein
MSTAAKTSKRNRTTQPLELEDRVSLNWFEYSWTKIEWKLGCVWHLNYENLRYGTTSNRQVLCWIFILNTVFWVMRKVQLLVTCKEDRPQFALVSLTVLILDIVQLTLMGRIAKNRSLKNMVLLCLFMKIRNFSVFFRKQAKFESSDGVNSKRRDCL